MTKLMSQFVADDYPAIAGALKLLSAPEAEIEFCPICCDEGYVEVWSATPPAFEVCQTCHNPKGKPLP